MANALIGSTTLKAQELNAAIDRAADALEKFQQELKDKLPNLPQQTALGRDAYVWLLHNVGLLRFTPEELLAMGRQEWNRAVAFEAYEKNRNKDAPPLKMATDVNTWINDAADKELQIRKFLEERGILTVPKWVKHYTLRKTPEYVRALGFTEHDDFTSPSRLNENCVRYVPSRRRNLSLFLARNSDGSKTDYGARRNSWSLFSALPLVEKRESNSTTLLRLRRERGHRLLR
jgi:hypothetical protein